MNDGGTAFPINGVRQEKNGEKIFVSGLGMSIRDYLAAKAMQAICSGCDAFGNTYYIEEVVARNAYKMADAMLKEREPK